MNKERFAKVCPKPKKNFAFEILKAVDHLLICQLQKLCMVPLPCYFPHLKSTIKPAAIHKELLNGKANNAKLHKIAPIKK